MYELHEHLQTLQQRQSEAFAAFVAAADERIRIEQEFYQPPTITEALQESPAEFAAGFSEEITIVTRRPDPMP